jgi:SAM-dependent methyltransferase
MLQRRALGGVLLVLFTSAITFAAELVAPYVNTVSEDVELMLDLATVGPEDYLIDLGSGDGRIVIAAARRGARGHGVELRPDLVTLATENAREAGVSDRAHFIEGDIFEADLTGASVVTAYLFPEANLQLKPKLLAELPPGTRVVSNAFHMGDWAPDRHEYGRTSGGAMLWIIPARVGGIWSLEIDGRQLSLRIEQRYQELEVSLHEAGEPIPVLLAKLDGRRIELSTGGRSRMSLTGLVEGTRMDGDASIDTGDVVSISRWQAVQSRSVTGSSRIP